MKTSKLIQYKNKHPNKRQQKLKTNFPTSFELTSDVEPVASYVI
jgi:hypothetical protein